VYALLTRGRAPSRLLVAYLIAGLVFTIAIGVIVIAAFSGVQLHAGSSETKGIAEIAAGAIAIAIGIAVLTGGVGRRFDDAPRTPGRFERILAREISTPAAALAGPATHIPGLFYLLALDLIVASQRDLASGLADVLLYNAVWFALPIAALILYIVNPPHARGIVAAIQAWAGAHTRRVILIVAFVGGPALIVAGWLAI
jgi:hypothetical protein